MARNVADGLWEMLVSAGVRRCYGIVGDALNPVIDALRRNGSVDFVHVRHEEWGVFAAASLYTGRLVNPHQLRTVVGRAITTAVAERGPTVISLPGDVAAADAPAGSLRVALP